MTLPGATSPSQPGVRYALDIGSTVVKLARLDGAGMLETQQFFPRDFEAGIARQVGDVLAAAGIDPERDTILACSSANGGLRIGIVCLTKHFSGAALRNQILLAGANPEFVHDMDEANGDSRRVDMLLVGGGIDCEDAGPAERRLLDFDPGRYRYGALAYAGNRFLADAFVQRFAGTLVIANPLADSLSGRVGGVFETVRRAYLDDLVFKEGVSELPGQLGRSIRPTPEVANRGFLRAVQNQSTFTIVGACIVLDIGGATTDLHYTVEVVSEASLVRPARGMSVARYVFTDIGIVASRDTLMAQLRGHTQLYEFLGAVLGQDVRDVFAALREGDYTPSPALLSYACLFLALDRFAKGRGPGLPTGDLDKVAQIILTGGAAQTLDVSAVNRVVALMLSPGGAPPLVQVDQRYEIWVGGITWTDDMPA
ncbi:MAG: glutamate mutase L [Rhodoferax sp.]|nr:glutamate mutase L [Rhodoferax sp.]